jgi:predicted DNA binding protein
VVEISGMLMFAVLTAYVDSSAVIIIRREASESPCYEREDGGLPIKYECIVRGIWTHESRCQSRNLLATALADTSRVYQTVFRCPSFLKAVSESSLANLLEVVQPSYISRDVCLFSFRYE